MSIDLPDETIELAQRLASDGEDAATVIQEGLALVAWRRQEVAAIQEGIDDYRAGRHRPWDEFFAEFTAERGLTREAR